MLRTKLSKREKRMGNIVRYLKRAYPNPKSELKHTTVFQFVVAVILSAQCADKKVNEVTKTLFKKYRTARDFAKANSVVLQKELSSIPLFRNKTRSIIGAANVVMEQFGGKVPKTAEELQTLPGVAYKTAHVILGEL